jgi:hypothetical protein
MGLESKDQKADFNRGGISYKNKSNQTIKKYLPNGTNSKCKFCTYILIVVPCILIILKFSPTNAQFIEHIKC